MAIDPIQRTNDALDAASSQHSQNVERRQFIQEQQPPTALLSRFDGNRAELAINGGSVSGMPITNGAIALGSPIILNPANQSINALQHRPQQIETTNFVAAGRADIGLIIIRSIPVVSPSQLQNVIEVWTKESSTEPLKGTGVIPFGSPPNSFPSQFVNRSLILSAFEYVEGVGIIVQAWYYQYSNASTAPNRQYYLSVRTVVDGVVQSFNRVSTFDQNVNPPGEVIISYTGLNDHAKRFVIEKVVPVPFGVPSSHVKLPSNYWYLQPGINQPSVKSGTATNSEITFTRYGQNSPSANDGVYQVTGEFSWQSLFTGLTASVTRNTDLGSVLERFPDVTVEPFDYNQIGLSEATVLQSGKTLAQALSDGDLSTRIEDVAGGELRLSNGSIYSYFPIPRAI